jgi:hypothetical protein
LAPALRIFSERAGGMFVVLALIGAADADAMARGAPVAVSISELARRIGSSRTHVIKLLNDAAADGPVDRPSGNGIVLLPWLSEAVHEFFAIGYLFLAHCAKAIREGHLGPLSVGGWPAPRDHSRYIPAQDVWRTQRSAPAACRGNGRPLGLVG